MANFSLIAKLGLDSKAFQTGIKNAEGRVAKMKAGVGKFGTALAGLGLSKIGMDAIQLGSKISDMAVQMNIGAEALQVLEFGAREAGVATSVMERALRNVQLRTEEATMGNKSYAEAFDLLGINIEEFRKLPTEKKLEAIAKAQANATDKQAAFNAVARILGQRAGPAMQEVLDDLATDGFANMAKAAKESGTVMSNETIAKMDEAADKIEQFKRRITVMSGEILAKAIPAFNILKQGLGFVGEMFGVGILNMQAFFRLLVTQAATAIQPAIKQFQALGIAAEAALTINPKKKIELFKQAAAKSKEAFGELMDLPGELVDNFEEFASDVKFNVSTLGDDLEDRGRAISESWSEALGEVKDEVKKVADEVKDIPASVDLGDGDSNIKKKGSKISKGDGDSNIKKKGSKISKGGSAGISSLAAIGGGGRVGRLATIEDKQLDELKIQTKVIQKVEKNTSKQTTSKFK